MFRHAVRSLAKRRTIGPAYRAVRGVYYGYVRPVLESHRGVIRRSPYHNIYYCCTQRTGSQWLKRVFQDPMIYKWTGLIVHEYQEIGLRQAQFSAALPANTIGTHLYVDYPTYRAIPKPERYKTFFVLRDPRDITVSWYFALRYSHGPAALVLEARKDLEGLTVQDGLRYSIDCLDRLGLFWAQKSWIGRPADDRPVKIFRYEDLAADQRAFLRELLEYLEIQLPSAAFAAVSERHQFKKLTGGRAPGVEDRHDHYRKGVAGDWRNYFDAALTAYFLQVTGDLLDVLGYLV